ncbi:Rha family transcriptional regulator [Stenotrophomonas sp. ESTM1D_MKCIP4_1]|nr:Rha family transcriptional regulator [Stenotrophomonas sp. ESTM1D_MKCIP4_1]
MDNPSASTIIDRLGGTGSVARLCEVRPASVSQWRLNGIPAARRQFLQLLRPDAFREEGSGDGHSIPPDDGWYTLRR